MAGRPAVSLGAGRGCPSLLTPLGPVVPLREAWQLPGHPWFLFPMLLTLMAIQLLHQEALSPREPPSQQPRAQLQARWQCEGLGEPRPCSEASAPWLLGDPALLAEYCLQLLTSDGEGSGAPGLSGQAPPPHTGPMEGWARGPVLSCPGPEPLPAQGPEPSCFRGTSMRGLGPADPAEGAALLKCGLHWSLPFFCCPVVAAAEPMAQHPAFAHGSQFYHVCRKYTLGDRAGGMKLKPAARPGAPAAPPPPVCGFLQLRLSPLGQQGQAAPVSKPSPRNKQGKKGGPCVFPKAASLPWHPTSRCGLGEPSCAAGSWRP